MKVTIEFTDDNMKTTRKSVDELSAFVFGVTSKDGGFEYAIAGSIIELMGVCEMVEWKARKGHIKNHMCEVMD